MISIYWTTDIRQKRIVMIVQKVKLTGTSVIRNIYKEGAHIFISLFRLYKNNNVALCKQHEPQARQ